MNPDLKKGIISLIPPFLGEFYQKRIRKVGYFGSYGGWAEAKQASTGYDSDLILERVKSALLKVRLGEAAYERDSVLFDRVQYAWPLLAGLLWVAGRSGNRLSVLDFGGSLGSSYFQNRHLLGHLESMNWSVVEQPSFVRCGKEHFADDILRFYESVDACLQQQQPNLILLSSVIPYIEKPYELVLEIMSKEVEYLIIDRTPLLFTGEDRITVQKVPAEIYPASYPAWILNRGNLLATICSRYELIAGFDALAGRIPLDDTYAVDQGFIFRRKG